MSRRQNLRKSQLKMLRRFLEAGLGFSAGPTGTGILAWALGAPLERKLWRKQGMSAGFWTYEEITIPASARLTWDAALSFGGLASPEQRKQARFLELSNDDTRRKEERDREDEEGEMSEEECAASFQNFWTELQSNSAR